MLSDEEREALDKLSSKKNETTWNDTIRQIKREEIKDVVVTRQKYITTVLNLIEKQSKEIEEAEQKEKKAYIDGTNVADKLCNEKWEDKIKAKIEECEKEIEKLYKKKNWHEPWDTEKKTKYMHYIEFGKSLLEKE